MAMLKHVQVELEPPTDQRRSETGFSLIELLIASTILLIVSSVVTSALMQMTTSQRTIWNRTEMHGGVRSATEETVQVSAVNSVSKQITISQSVDYNGTPLQASFLFTHAAGAVVTIPGG